MICTVPQNRSQSSFRLETQLRARRSPTRGQFSVVAYLYSHTKNSIMHKAKGKKMAIAHEGRHALSEKKEKLANVVFRKASPGH